MGIDVRVSHAYGIYQEAQQMRTQSSVIHCISVQKYSPVSDTRIQGIYSYMLLLFSFRGDQQTFTVFMVPTHHHTYIYA